MGTLASTLAQGAPADPRLRCGVADWLRTLDHDDRAELDRVTHLALTHQAGWTVTKLHKACTTAGLTVQYNRFRSHITGGCSCALREDRDDG